MEKPNPDVLREVGLKTLSKTWARIEILLGLAAVFMGATCGIAVCAKIGEAPSPLTPDFQYFSLGFLLFVLGGYLTLAGQRSHLYQSSNLATAVLIEQIRKKDQHTNEHPG